MLATSIGALRRETKADIDTILQRFAILTETASGISVTPESCMRSPTVRAIVNAVAFRVATLPVHVMEKAISEDGRESKRKLPSHPVQRLLNSPNGNQTSFDYLNSAVSWWLRYGNFYAFKGRGLTGPIRFLQPLHPGATECIQELDNEVKFRHTEDGGRQRDLTREQVHHIRNLSRDGICGDSPIQDIKESIAMEIAAEQFGASFFGNGAVPLMVFKSMQGIQGFRTDEQRDKFIDGFQEAYTGKRRHRAMFLPPGMDVGQSITVDNEKHQFIEIRGYQRTVIAGAFGIPPHKVGDLSRATYNNVEQQNLDWVTDAVIPCIRAFETSMERDLLTLQDRRNGVVIRFNVDAALRADFNARQQGNWLQFQAGALSANEWRESEGRNPREGGDEYRVPSNTLPSSGESEQE